MEIMSMDRLVQYPFKQTINFNLWSYPDQLSTCFNAQTDAYTASLWNVDTDIDYLFDLIILFPKH